MNKTINIDGVEYNLVPVPSTQEVTKQKPQTGYRKNGALVFAPEIGSQYYIARQKGDIYSIHILGWQGTKENVAQLQQGLIFNNQEACQIWAGKLKTAYALKQRIVESESEDEALGYCCVCWNTDLKEKDYFYNMFDLVFAMLFVSTNAKDILMSKDVSNEDFKAFIEVFSL